MRSIKMHTQFTIFALVSLIIQLYTFTFTQFLKYVHTYVHLTNTHYTKLLHISKTGYLRGDFFVFFGHCLRA